MLYAHIREMHQPSAVGKAKQADMNEEGLVSVRQERNAHQLQPYIFSALMLIALFYSGTLGAKVNLPYTTRLERLHSSRIEGSCGETPRVVYFFKAPHAVQVYIRP